MEDPAVPVEQTGAKQERMIPLSAVAPLLGWVRERIMEREGQCSMKSGEAFIPITLDPVLVAAHDRAARAAGLATMEDLLSDYLEKLAG